MMVSRIAAVLIALLAGSPRSFAETPPDAEPTPAHRLTLAQCIERARAHNPRLLAERLTVAAAAARERQARLSRYLPSFKLKSFVGPSPEVDCGTWDPTCDPEDPTCDPAHRYYRCPAADLADFSRGGSMSVFTRTEVDLVQPLYTFGRIEALVDAAHAGTRAREAGAAAREAAVAEQVKELHSALLLARENLALVNDVIGSLDEAERKVEERIEEGEATTTDLLKLRVFRGEVKRRRIEIEKRGDQAHHALGLLIGLAPEESFELAEEYLEPRPVELGSLDDHLQGGVASDPRAQAAARGLEARRASLRAARSTLFPQFFLGGTFRYAYAPNRDDPHDPFVSDYLNTLQAGAVVGFSQNLSFHITAAKLDRAAAEVRTAEQRLRTLEGALTLEQRRILREVEAAREAMEEARRTRKAGRGWLHASSSAFDLGVVEVKELLDAYGAYIKTRGAHLKAIHDYNAAVATLERVIGRDLSEEGP